MKRKELLQKSSTVAAVVLAAALMDPGTVQASAGDQSAVANASQVMEQSVETEGEAVSESVTEDDQKNDGQTEETVVQAAEEAAEATEAEASTEKAESTTETEEKQDAQEQETKEESHEETTAESTENAVDSNTDAAVETGSDDAEETVTAGWIQNEDGSTSYRKEDGSLAYREIIFVDGFYYGFDWDCKLYQDGEFSTADNIWYRAREDGKLVTGWYEDAYSNKYYYGTDGKGYRGIQTVDGKQYFFDYNARMQSGGTVEADGKIYIVGTDGVLTEAKNNTWTQVDGEYYYLKDGALLESCVEKIGNSYYGFDWNGKMRHDERFYLYSDGQYNYYRAKEDGTLVIGWYEDEDSRKYYYGADGKGYEGIQSVDGKYYYFIDGRVSSSAGDVYSGEPFYIAGKDGALTEAKNNSWTKVDDDYYYLQDGELLKDCIQKIGNAYYGFDCDGKMYNETEFSIYDSENGTDSHYYAKPGGALAIGWYENDGDQYYYGTDGKRYENRVEKIGNDYYGFDWYGNIYKDRTFSMWEDGEEIQYRALEDGKLATGWYENEYGDTYYYEKDGKGAKGILTIDGKQYYFYEHASLAKNEAIEQDGKYYVAGDDGVLTEAKNNNWTKVDGHYYYVKDGKFLKSQVEKIGNAYYAFDSDGVMYDDCNFSLWDEADQEQYCYRAKAGGALYVNCWYEQYSSKYYYGESGKGYEGIHTINGKQYYFSDACLDTNSTVDVDGKHYVAGNDGALTEAGNNAWTKVDGTYYYLKDGKFLKDGIEKIGNAYYGFNWYGQMYSNTVFSFWDSDAGKDVYYRAKENGALITGWYYEDGDNYYYDTETDRIGKGADGWRNISGKLYYFQNGRMCKNIAAEKDGKNYVIDNSGNAVEAKNNVWTEVDGYYYYVKNGKFLNNQVEKIGNAYYGFDGYGKMYQDNSFSIYDREKGENYYYRAKENGALYISSWYEDRYNSYYYGADGKGYEDYQTVNGKQYYFSAGRMYQNESIRTPKNGKYYIAGADGALVEAKNNAWNKVSDRFYYLKNNEFLRDCVVQIGNAWYGFDYDGHMYEDTAFEIWDSDKGDQYYRAKKNGTLMTGWYESGDERWYYGTDYAGYEGLQKVDGKQYYFSAGRVCRSQAIETNNKCYVADKNGTLTEVHNNVWVQIEGKYYYAKNKKFLRNCVEKIDGSYYGFDDNGALYVNTDFSKWDSPSDKGKYYRANEKGVLYRNSWYQDSNGNWYYYGADAKAYEGMQSVGGKQYYFENGRMCKEKAVTVNGKAYLCKTDGTMEVMKNNTWKSYEGEYYYVKNNTALNSCVEKIGMYYYGFDQNGQMYNDIRFELYVQDASGRTEYKTFFAKKDGALYQNSWVKGYGNWYYAGADGSVYVGLKTIGGKQYYFNEYGQLSVNTVDSVQNKIYSSDENGVLTEVKGNNVWKNLHGQWYYIQNNKLLKDTVCKIGNDYYGFDSEGAMRTDRLFYNSEKERYYFADQNGKLAKNSWVKWNGKWYYFGKDATGAEGIQTINGKTYYFESGYMVVKQAFTAGNKNYAGKADGSLAALKENAWTTVEGKRYYVQNGSVLSDCVKKIGTSYYGFDEDGAMIEKGFFRMDGEDGERYTYFAAENGKLVTSTWKSDGNCWYYFGKDGSCLKGIQTVNGKKYYFGYEGVMLVNRFVESENGNYIAKADGTLKKAADNAWTKGDDGHWYYVKNGRLCESEVIQIAGKYYGFDGYGRMYTDEDFYISDDKYYASENGELYTSKWMGNGSGGWMYFGKDGKAFSNSVQTINGVKYLFGWNKVAPGESLQWNGKNYAADENGKAVELNEKWNQVGLYWYYVKNGKILTHTVETIGSNTYYFNQEGQMVTNSTSYVSTGESFDYSGTNVTTDQSGYVQKNKTYELWNGTYMSDANGNGVDGFRTVNGRKCYFVEGYMQKDTSFQIGDTWYVAAADGKVTELSSNGWTKADGNWYYLANGKLIQQTRYTIDEKTYVFGYHGRLLSEEGTWDGELCYGAAKDGTMLKNTWSKIKMHTEKDGSYDYYVWAYFDESGQAVEGFQTINGKQYYFGSFMVSDQVVTAKEGTLYIADSNGVLKEVNQDGWTQAGNYWYYSVNGVPARGEIRKIDNAYYAFDSAGRMYKNKTFYMDGSIYHADNSGKLIRNGSWKDSNGTQYYFDANGAGYEGVHKVNGVSYYFSDGVLLKNAAVQSKEGNLYVLDSKGKQHTMAGNQWVKVDGYYYYAQNGRIAKNEILTINGKYYAFDGNGRMFANQTFELDGLTYHAAAGGALVTGTQYKSGKDTYYFDRNGCGYEGVHYIAGKRCVFSGGKLIG